MASGFRARFGGSGADQAGQHGAAHVKRGAVVHVLLQQGHQLRLQAHGEVQFMVVAGLVGTQLS